MSDLDEATEQLTINKERRMPAIFLNRDGEPEWGTASTALSTPGVDILPFTSRDDVCSSKKLVWLSESIAVNRLQRALFETGQLIVTTKDGLSRVCFAGMGDPERLFVESVPRDVPVPAWDCDFPGCLCTLAQATALLRRVYRGERSSRIGASLNRLAAGRRKRRVAAVRALRAA